MRSNIKKWVWDIEVYPNLFLLCGQQTDTKEKVAFEISEFRDDRQHMIQWMRDVDVLIGYNSLHYDTPILYQLMYNFWKLEPNIIAQKCYGLSKQIIIDGENLTFKEGRIQHIDLKKVNHLDNKNRRVSLKTLEFNFRMENIQELPYDPHRKLSSKQIMTLTKYCFNDVDATQILYERSINDILLREALSEQHNKNFINYNAPKIGEYILINMLSKKIGRNKIYDNKGNVINTHRDKIVIRDIIFDYIKFDTEPFIRLLQWFKQQTIIGTKNVFTNIRYDDLVLLKGLYNRETKSGRLSILNVLYKGFQYDFGVGGVHGYINDDVFVSDASYSIIDIDVKSYYPNLAIRNRFYPEHLNEDFCDIYEDIYNQRARSKKGSPENAGLKLALNGSYGKSNSVFSPLYDPQYMITTTINGQLLLCKLSEMLHMNIEDIKLLQINTDGLTIKIKNTLKNIMYEQCKKWEILSKGLELEYTFYRKMIIKDVNNYIAVDTTGKIKRKGGIFIYKVVPGELELFKNHSMLIIKKALEQYYIHDIKPENYIHNHSDIYDFCKRTNLNRNSKLYSRLGGTENELQKTSRYYISGYGDNNIQEGIGYVLIKKIYDTTNQFREFNLEKNYLCTICNNIKDGKRSDIYEQYYIDKVYSFINTISGNKKIQNNNQLLIL